MNWNEALDLLTYYEALSGEHNFLFKITVYTFMPGTRD